MAAGDLLLDVVDVALSLGGNPILAGVSLKIRDRVREGACTGQIAALLGPSGIGKTRLLRIIAGLDAADNGSVTGIGGQPLVPGSVGVVFQNYPLIRHRTVLDNLVVAGAMAGLDASTARSKAGDLLERFGLAARGGLYPSQLSGGQRQRAAIAQQVMCQRNLLILDEPFSGLDPAALLDVVELLVEVANMHEANTLLIISHDIRAVLLASDLVFMLGRRLGPKGELLPGAVVRASYDLVAMGLAWRDDVEQDPGFVALEQEIKRTFKGL